MFHRHTVVDEAAAITQSQQGDVQAFNRLVECYQVHLFATCYWLLGDVDAAEDVSQEVFRSAFRMIRRYRGGSFVAWLLGIAKNECFARRRERGERMSIDTTQKDVDGAPCQFETRPEVLEERGPRAERGHRLERLLLALPDDQRLVVVLSDVQGYNYAEIVAATGWPLDTIKSRLSRGRMRLRAAVAAEQVQPDADASLMTTQDSAT